MGPAPRDSNARQGGWFFIAAGMLTILNNEVPGGEYLDKGFMFGLGAGCILLGLVIFALPWRRWPRWTELSMPLVAFGLIALANDVGSVSAYTFGTFFVFVFVWIGLAQPPGTSIRLAPVAAVAYALPGLVGGIGTRGAVSSLPVAIPVCVLGGETIARGMGNVRDREAQVAAKQAQYERLVEMSDQGIWELDAEGATIFVNVQMAGMLGYGPEEMVGRPFSLFVSGDVDVDAVIAAPGSELVLRHREGRAVLTTVTMRPIEGHGGWRAGAVATLTDVTEVREQEAAFRRSHDMLDRSQALAGLGSWEIDLPASSSSSMRWSRETYRIFGVEPAAFPTTFENIAALIHPADRARFAIQARQTVDTGRGFDGFDFRIVRPEGTMRWVWAQADVDSSRPGTLVGFVQDVTERKRVEEELERSTDEALRASRMKSEFLATMSHEIRTPMNGVMGMTELLLGTDLDPVQRDYAETVERSAAALLAILNDILDLSKIEAGRLELEQVIFDLAALVEDVGDLWGPDAAARGLDFVVEVDPDLPTPVLGDPGRLRQVLANLVSNAVKFTDAGRVGVSVRAERVDDASVDVRLEVRDTGCGLDPAMRDHLFEPFTQADASTTRRYGGTGLGLTIARRLVSLMGGEIDVESEPGRGSTFSVTVGLARVSPAPVGPPDDLAGRRPARPGSRGRVLVVDDSPLNLRIAVLFLRRMGFEVDEAGDGRAAVAAAARSRYDAVLMDCQMPEMDGYAAAGAIRSLGGRSGQVPIVALTASAMQADVERAMAAGMDAHVAKPIDSGKLEAAMAGLLLARPADRSA